MSSMFDLFAIIISIIVSFLYIIIIFKRTRHFDNINKIIRYPQFIALFIATTASIVTIMTVFSHESFFDFFKSKTEKNALELDSTLKQLDSLTILINNYGNVINEMKSNDSTISRLNYDLEIAELNTNVNSLKSSMNKFEGLLISDAEKLITLPLLKKEVDGVKVEIKSLSDNIHAQNDLIKDMQSQTWSLVGILGLGILALIIPLIKGTFGSPTKHEELEK